jgi:3-phenylpropionate/cinnamic acid dioxygenase small subunit
MAAYPDPELRRLLLAREVEELLYHEAELLDERRFAEWLDLFTDDARYFMPLRRNVRFGEHAQRENTREQAEVAWFDEGKDTLARRVQQIATGIHWGEEPLSRTCHLVSNVQILEDSGAELRVKSRFLLYRNRLQDETDILAGKREDTLRRVDGRLRIARRTIILDQNVLLAKNLSFFL